MGELKTIPRSTRRTRPNYQGTTTAPLPFIAVIADMSIQGCLHGRSGDLLYMNMFE